MSELITREAFKVIEGRPVTSSLKVAEYFEKRHSDVIRAIENLCQSKPDLRQRNFALTEEIKQVGAATRKTPFYWMDRKGFSILAMGFTGAKALDFKCAFYDEFERMERALHEGPRETISEAQQREIQREVGRKAAATKQFAVVYRALKDRFAIPRYTALLSRDFDEAIRFIRAIELPPVLPKEEQKPAPLPKPAPQPAHHSGACPCCGLTPVEEGDVVLNSYEAERLATFFYFLFYLCKREYEAFYKMLRTVNSPLAGKFFDAFHEIRLLGIDDILAEHGHAIQDLKCYQAWAAKQLHGAK